MNKIFLINVGVNAAHGKLRSPILEDGTFKFVPIPEEGRWHSFPHSEELMCYRDLAPLNVESNLMKVIPKEYYGRNVHNDPEFDTFTYGDYPTRSPRAANLKRIKSGDYLFFLARLVRWLNGRLTSEAGFYIIAYFEIDKVYSNLNSRPNDKILEEIIHNAHVQRALVDPSYWNSFWVFKGSENSRRLKYAIPFSREFAERVLEVKNGCGFRWNQGRTDLQVIGSHTRACRIIESLERTKEFWSFIKAEHE